jgi:hypothetical protein
MATIRTQLYRDNEAHSWVTAQVLNRNKMLLTFTNEKGETVNVGGLSKKDAEQLGDIIRNASIDYMEDSEE